MPFINIDVPLYARDVSTREIIYIIIINNINTDHIMRNLQMIMISTTLSILKSKKILNKKKKVGHWN